MGYRVTCHTTPRKEVGQGVAVGRKKRAATLPHHPTLKGGGGGVASCGARPASTEVGHAQTVPMPGLSPAECTGALLFIFHTGAA